MKSVQPRNRIDHYLVTRAQARINGANAHNVHALLGNYFGLCSLPEQEFAPRVAAVERRLRVFCQTGELPPSRRSRRALFARPRVLRQPEQLRAHGDSRLRRRLLIDPETDAPALRHELDHSAGSEKSRPVAHREHRPACDRA